MYHKAEKRSDSKRSSPSPKPNKTAEDQELLKIMTKDAVAQQAKSSYSVKGKDEGHSMENHSERGQQEDVAEKRRDDWIPAVEGTVKCDQCNFLALNIRRSVNHHH